MAKSWFPKSNKPENKLRGDDSQQTRPAELRPRRGEGNLPPGLGGFGGSEVQEEKSSEDRKKEDRREEKFGGLEERRAIYTQTGWVGGV